MGLPLDEHDPEHTHDADLVRRAKDGDVDAYAALLRAHQGAAARLAAALCGPGDADEVAQDAFVKAWYGLPGFRAEAPFRPWLLRIVANEARNRRRSAGRRAGHELRFAGDRAVGRADPPPDSTDSPESAVLAADARRALRAALTRLPERQRDVITCRYVVGLSEAETAEVLGVARGTVKSRAARGLARLRHEVDLDLPGASPAGADAPAEPDGSAGSAGSAGSSDASEPGVPTGSGEEVDLDG